jgi:hypothetical protein
MIKIKECRESNPTNSLSGLYVQLLGSYNELSILGPDKAKELANEKGFNPSGKTDMGYPVSYGLNTYTKSFWFFDREVN